MAETTETPTTTAPDDLAFLARDWDRSLRAEGKSPATRVQYVGTVSQFVEHLAERGMPLAASKLNREHCEDYLAHVIETRSAATAHTRHKCLKLFLDYLVEEGELTASPMRNVKPPQLAEKPVPLPSDAEIAALLKACRGTDFEARRDAALVSLLVDTGARLSELTNLTLADVDLDLDVITVVGKGSKERSIPFSAKAGKDLSRYLRARRRHPWKDRTEALWLGGKGAMTPSGVRQVIRRRSREAGIDPPLHPHQLRHYFAHTWLAQGGQEADLQRLAGWSSPQMIRRYGASGADQRARDAHQRFSPRDRLG